MSNSSVSNSEKVETMRAAVVAHKAYASMANGGDGIDRHFLGLKRIALENNITIPSILTDKAFDKSTHFMVKTSQVSGLYILFIYLCYIATIFFFFILFSSLISAQIIIIKIAFRVSRNKYISHFKNCLAESFFKNTFLYKRTIEKLS